MPQDRSKEVNKAERDLLRADVDRLRGFVLRSDSPDVAALFRVANAAPALLDIADERDELARALAALPRCGFAMLAALPAGTVVHHGCPFPLGHAGPHEDAPGRKLPR